MHHNDFDAPLDSGIQNLEKTEELQVSDSIQKYWKEIAGWASFLGYLFFFSVIVIILAMYIASDEYLGLSVSNSIPYVIGAIVAFITGYFYWAFGTGVQRGFNRSETEVVAGAFKNLANAYRFTGWVTILYLILMVAALVYFFVMTIRRF